MTEFSSCLSSLVFGRTQGGAVFFFRSPQVDHPQNKKEPMGQESAIQMGGGGLESHGQEGQHHAFRTS